MQETIYDQSAFQLYAAVCLGLIFCISLAGNSFILWLLLRERAWRITSDILLLQLTVSNLCFTAILPFLACKTLHRWIFGEWVCRVVRGLLPLALKSHVVILTAMTLHCYITMVQPSCLTAHTSSKFRVLLASIAIWMISAGPGIKYAVNSQVLYYGDVEICTSGLESVIVILIDVNVGVWLFYVTPGFIVTFCHMHIWIMMKRRRVTSYPLPFKLISRVTAVFFLCWAPHNIEDFAHSLMFVRAIKYSDEWRRVTHYTMYITFTLLHMYPCLNPMFHMFGAARFRRHLPTPCITERGYGGRSDTSVEFMSLETTDV